MLKIFIENLKVDAIIGILPNERVNPQKIEISFEAFYIYKDKNFIDYSLIREVIIENLLSKKYFLLEDAIEDLTQKIENKYPLLSNIKFKIKKLEIFNDCIVGVENCFNANI